MATIAQNKSLLQRIYAEASEGNVQLLLDSLADDIRWTIIGNTPLSGTFNGKTEVVERLFKPLRSRLNGKSIVWHADRFIAEGEYIVMQARGQATARNGKPYNNSYCIVYRLMDGKIKEMTEYLDTELVVSALG